MINNILYLNNRYITSYKDLKEVFELLKDENKRPEFLQDEILEAFYSGTLTKWLASEPEMSKCYESTNAFFQQIILGDIELEGKNAVIRRLTELIIGNAIEVIYDYKDFFEVTDVTLKRNEEIIKDPDCDFHSPQIYNHLLSFNQCVELDEKLIVEFELEIKKVINDSVLISISTNDGTNNILLGSVKINLSNAIVGDKKKKIVELDIIRLKHFKEGVHKITFEDQKKNELYSCKFFNHSNYNYEIPLTQHDEFKRGYSCHYRSIRFSPHKDEGIVFNKMKPEGNYNITFLFEVLKESDAIVNFRFQCESLCNYEKSVEIDLKNYKKFDIVSLSIDINYEEYIKGSKDGCHKIKMLPSQDWIETPSVYVFGDKITLPVHYSEGPLMFDNKPEMDFISYCDARTNVLYYYSKYVMGHDFDFFRLRNYGQLDIKFDLDDVVKFLSDKCLNKNGKIRYDLPSTYLAKRIYELYPDNHVEEYTNDHKDGWTERYLTFIDENGDDKQTERVTVRKFAFRLCFKRSYNT